MNIKFFIHCWLDVEGFLGVSKQPFMKKVRSGRWTIKRLQLFKTYTWPSLMNQNFNDFQILLFCSPKHKAIHFEALEKELATKQLLLLYDFGRHFYSRQYSDFINITRIDSDDMFRFDFMDEVAKKTIADPNKRTCLVFKKVIQWNIYHKFISDYTLPRSPFCSHTFPRKIYSEWKQLAVQQFMDYKSCIRRGSPGKVCIIRHGDNVTFPRIGKDMKGQKYYDEEMRKRNNICSDPSGLHSILAHFGVSEKLVIR